MKNNHLQDLLDSYRENFSLPAAFYRDTELYQSDLEAVFYRKWIYAGHLSQLADSGDFLTVEFGNESIIVARSKDRKIRAFANVCRHRGSRICLQKSGNARFFVCPYHAWTYDLDGSLRSRRAMPEGFDRSQWGLKIVNSAVFKGLVFINLDPDTPNLEEAFEDMAEPLAIYDIENTKVARQQTFEVDANWKLTIENFMECYHCAPAHIEYAASHALQSPKDYAELRPKMLEQSAEVGYTMESIDKSNPTDENDIQHFYSRSAMYATHVTGSRDGKPVAPLLGNISRYGGGAADVQFGPVTFAIFYADHIVLYRFLPRDVQKSDMEIIWLVKSTAEEGKDYNCDDLTWLWTVTTEADKAIILNNQLGANSRFYEPGPLSEMESFITVFTKWYLDQIKIHLHSHVQVKLMDSCS